MPRINNEMLVVARQLRLMTQDDVCLKADISQGILSKAENGLRELQDDVLERLSHVYDLPISFFYRENDTSPVSHLYFRRKLSLSAKTIDSFVAKSRIIKFALDDLFNAVDLPAYDIGTYDPNEFSPQDIADKIRYKLKVFRGPVPNLTALLENHGIVIWKMDFETDKIDGLSTVTNSGQNIIFLNSQMPNDRIRFSLAHELGHMVMHMETPPPSVEIAEEQADAFASQFLMPEDEIKPMLYNLRMVTLAELKRRWNVSMRSLIRRARDLNTISQDTYRYFQIDFSRRKYNKIEPVSLPAETPSLVKSTLSLYRDELNYSDEDMLEVMKINKKDYENWFIPVRNKVIPLFRIG